MRIFSVINAPMLKLLLFLCCLPVMATAQQTDSVSLNFIHSVLRAEQANGTILYSDKISKHLPTNIYSQLLNKDSISGLDVLDYRDGRWVSLKLSAEDKKDIRIILQKTNTWQWKDNLFENSRRMPADSVQSYLRKHLITYIEDRKRSDSLGTARTVSRYVNVFMFAPPIYLNNRKFVLFYFWRDCGSDCGVDELCVYRLENGVYKKWILLSGGAF